MGKLSSVDQPNPQTKELLRETKQYSRTIIKPGAPKY